jgi:hypothetical protein
LSLGNFLIGLLIFVIALFALINRQWIEIDPDKNTICDYSLFVFQFKLIKNHNITDYKYITIMPLIESQQIYVRSNNSTIMTNNYATITLFKNNLR